MGLAPYRDTFMRRTKRSLHHFLALVLVVSTLSAISVVSPPEAKAAYTVSNTNEVITTTGGGGYITANCDTGGIVRSVGATGLSSGAVLTRPTAVCYTLNAQETLANVTANTIGGTASWGGAGDTTLTSVTCSESQGVVGLVVHKTAANGYVSGFQVICGNLLDSSSRSTSDIVFGWSNAGASSPSQRETITCPTGMFAVGMSAYVGSIMDKIGFKCGAFTVAPGAPTIGVATATGTTSATVAFTAPASNGGGTISSYTATSSPGGLTGTLSQAGSGTISVTGLTNGTAYTFTVTATNAAGTSSASSASNSVTPANSYTVTYNYNSADGGNSTVSNSFTTGGTAITLPTPTKTSFIFDGWYEAEDLSGSALGSTYSPTQTRTIYAKWIAVLSGSVSVTGNNSLNSQQTANITGVTRSGSPTVTYQWSSASSAAGTYTNISGATSSTYTPSNSTYSYLKVAVTFTYSIAANAVTILSSAKDVSLLIDLNSSDTNVATPSATTWSPSNGTTPTGTFSGTGSSSMYNSADKSISLDHYGAKYVTVANGTQAANDAINVSGDITVEAQIYIPSYKAGSDGGWNIIATKWFSGSGTPDWHFAVKAIDANPTTTSVRRLNLYTNNGGGGGASNVYGTLDVTAGAWHTVGFKLASGALTFYLDGVADSRGGSYTRVPNTSFALYVGDYRVGTGIGLDGKISRFRMFSRAITDGEALSFNSQTITYAAGTGGSGSAPTTPTSVSNGSTFTTPANTYSRTGYTFAGWSDGANTYAAAATYPSTGTVAADVTLTATWTVDTLNVTYDAKGGTSVTAVTTLTGGAISSAPTPPTKANYTFAGWSDTDGGSAVTFPFTHGKTADFTIYALWTANSYVLTYVYNSATGDSSTVTSSFTTGGTAITLPTPTRTGYTFAGWYADALFATSIGVGGATHSPTGTSLTPTAYANWTGINRTVTYSAATATGGAVPTDASNYIIGSSVVIKGNTGSLVRTGYTFAGWTYASDGTGTVLTSGTTYTTATSNMVFYANWSANTYTVTYNINGAAGLPTTSSATYTTGGAALTLTTVGTMAKTGFDFGGWSATPTGIALSGTYTTTVDATLFAVWTIKSISISFAKGDASASSFFNFPSNRSSNFGTTIRLTDTVDSSVTIGGVSHAFMGWNDGTSVYQSGASYLLGETAPTFTATWVKIFAVRYAFNGGTAAVGSSAVDAECLAAGETCTDGQVITANAAPTRTGYTFGGWVDQNNVAVTAGDTFTVGTTRYLIYANWTPVDYAITYSTAGGSTPATPFTKQIGQTFTVAAAPTKTGYTFTGWSDGTSNFGVGVTYYVATSAVTLTAQWSANIYTIVYDWNGGSGSTTSNGSFTVGGSAVTLPAVGDHVKDGYTFAGWSTTDTGSLISGGYSPTADSTLYAIWGTGSYTISYDANGGSVSTASASILNGSTLTLPTPTRTSFVFDGWYSASTGGSLIGAAAATYQPTQSRTVYARWIQASIYGIDASALTRIGTTTASSSSTSTFSSSNGISSVSVSVPAGSLPNGTTINFDLVGDFTRAQSVLTAPNTYIISLVVSWLATNGTVPDTASDKPISVTITNNTIRAGASVYAIVGGVATLLGTAILDGTVTVSITSDPEVVVVSTKPSAPTSVAATSYATAQSVVTWIAPSDGGSAITGYTVTSSGGQTCTTVTTSCTVSTLLNSTAYTFTVTATNTNGTSSASSSASATTAGKPDAPISVTASAGGTQESLITWSAPASDGGSAITSYTATANGGAFCTTASTSCTITGLSDGTTYTFAITATNALGISEPSLSVSAKTADAVVSGGGSSAGGGGSGGSSGGRNNVTVVAPVTVVGDQDTKGIAVQISTPAAGTDVKPALISIDKASAKFIAEVKVVEGKLVLTPETGFSGKKTVTVTITENGVDRIVQIPLTVLPEVVTKPVLTPTSYSRTTIRWAESPNANAYTVYLNGKKVCSTSASSCVVRKVLGPDALIEIISNGGDRTVSEKIEADFKQNAPVQITRLVSATITKSTLSKVDIKALDKVIALIKSQGFGTIVISEITTTKRTQAKADARITAIKKYIKSKSGSEKVEFEVVPPSKRTYLNNISVKG